MKKNPLPRLYRIREVAELIGCSESTVRNLVRLGSMPHVKIGYTRRVRADDLERFVRSVNNVLPPTVTITVDPDQQPLLTKDDQSLYYLDSVPVNNEEGV